MNYRYRRQLTHEKQAFLLDDLSKQYETGRGVDRHSEDFKEDNLSFLKENVNEKPAKKVNVVKPLQYSPVVENLL